MKRNEDIKLHGKEPFEKFFKTKSTRKDLHLKTALLSPSTSCKGLRPFSSLILTNIIEVL